MVVQGDPRGSILIMVLTMDEGITVPKVRWEEGVLLSADALLPIHRASVDYQFFLQAGRGSTGGQPGLMPHSR